MTRAEILREEATRTNDDDSQLHARSFGNTEHTWYMDGYAAGMTDVMLPDKCLRTTQIVRNSQATTVCYGFMETKPDVRNRKDHVL
jgi:hypothetical protein